MRILVVEDEVRLGRHVASALTEAGHDPVVIHDGETALGEAERTPFDLVVLDVGLPGMDGFKVLKKNASEKYVAPSPDVHRAGRIERPRNGPPICRDEL